MPPPLKDAPPPSVWEISKVLIRGDPMKFLQKISFDFKGSPLCFFEENPANFHIFFQNSGFPDHI